ncbi:MAG: PIN domain-containing protein [Planctomycetaceae bacterium]|jgi:predicted nucleic acid-binding protein|nr:PIN domain-containing protein [Planctomycetaceae bacterium]
MIYVLFDSDVVIDFFLDREPFSEESRELFLRLLDGQFSALMTAPSILNIYYLIRKPLGRQGALECIGKILETSNLSVLSVEKQHLLEALESAMTDYEDAVQASVADAANLDYIVTRNLKDYRQSLIKAVSPKEFISQIVKGR